MMHEPDGVAAEVEQLLQRGGQVAADIARNRTVKRAHELRQTARESEQRAREAQARLDAERQLARAQLANVERDEWWERAGAEEIVDAWDTACQWREHDPAADHAVTHMRAQMIERLGVNPETVAANPLSEAAPAGTDRPGPIGDRGAELQTALADLRESRRVGAAAEQHPLAETIRRGGPTRAPRPRPGRGRTGSGAERERGR